MDSEFLEILSFIVIVAAIGGFVTAIIQHIIKKEKEYKDK